MSIIFNLDASVDAYSETDFLNRSIRSFNLESDILTGLQVVIQSLQAIGFRTFQLEGIDIRPIPELQWQDAHSNEIGSVYALEALGYNSFDTE